MKNKIKINISILLYTLYIIFIILNDYICYIGKFKTGIITYLCSFIIVCLILFFTKNRFEIKKERFNKIDIIFIILLCFISSLRISIPDSSFDTLNYHLYLQESVFDNNVSFNFFPSRWINTFSLPLGDRMHYFFRFFLGYRLGNILNLLCIIVIYYQVKRFLTKKIKDDNLISVFAISIILTEQIMTNMITYYVDLLSIPIFLEIILIILEKDKKNISNLFTLLLAGISISLKVSNAMIIIILGLIYIFKNYKKINKKTLLIGIPILVFPFLIYMINNYIQTGNPVFPFYNSIFKSKFLLAENWVENGYGPKNIVERMLWPLYTLINPRRAYDTDVYYGRIAYGYIFSILILIISVYKYYKEHKKLSYNGYLAVLYIVFSIIWSNFMMGYIRYVLFLEILSGIIIILFIYENYRKKYILSLINIFGILSLAYVNILTMSNLIDSPTEISWRYSFYNNEEKYKNNFKYILNRKWDYSDKLTDVSCFGIVDYNSGYARLLSNKIPVIDLHEGYNNNYGKNKMKKTLKSCKNLYTVSTAYTRERTNKYVEKLGYKNAGSELVFKTDFLDSENDLVIFKIEK